MQLVLESNLSERMEKLLTEHSFPQAPSPPRRSIEALLALVPNRACIAS